MQRKDVALGLAATLGVATWANRALAEPFTERRVGLGAGLDYRLYLGGLYLGGLYLGDAAGEIPAPYGLGLGARAGYTFDPNLYLGAKLNYFFGTSRRFPQYGDVEGSLRILEYGAEGGYDFGIGRFFALRPKVGIGAARVTANVRVEGLTGEVSETVPNYSQIPTTTIGVRYRAKSPFPSSPLYPAPQHRTPPVVISAQV